MVRLPSSAALVARTLFAIGLAGGMFAGASVQAQLVTRSERVRVDDLDLTTERGRKKLDRRIRSAAHLVCSASSPGPRGRLMPAERDCVKKALARAAVLRDKAIARTMEASETPPRIAAVRVYSRPTVVAEEVRETADLDAPRPR